MKIVAINSSLSGSTGKIMLGLSNEALAAGHTVFMFTPAQRGKKVSLKNHFFFGNVILRAISKFFSFVFGIDGVGIKRITRSLIKKIEKINPDIIHLHNIHAWFIDVPTLFGFLQKTKAKVVWTFHDCWPFTGHCTYFSLIGCDKWKKMCFKCPQLYKYPRTLVDNSKKQFVTKKNLFTTIDNLTIVTPSFWMKELVGKSFLCGTKTFVVNNGVDLSIFKPSDNVLENNLKPNVILGVAFGWEQRKGIDVFIRIANDPEMSDYQVVLVGTTEAVERSLPNNIKTIRRTNNQKELADLYSKSLLLLNPTREDNYPTVNLESISCGTPVVTFDTGGSKESVFENCGVVVKKDDYEGVKAAIRKIYFNVEKYRKECATKRLLFEDKISYSKYLTLFGDLMRE